MKTIYLEIENHMQRTEKENNSVLLWYNMAERKMERFYGTNLVFKYNPTSKKNVVSAQSIKSATYKSVSNKQQIDQWIQNNVNMLQRNAYESNSRIIAIDVDDENYESICESLYDNRIRFSE